jgi:hypothetical protein
MAQGTVKPKEANVLINHSRAFTKAGYHVACIGRSAENLSKLGKEITEAGGHVSYQVLISLALRTQKYNVFFFLRRSRSALRTTLINNLNLHGMKSDAVSQMTSISSQQLYGTLDMGSLNLSSIPHRKRSEKACRSTSRLHSPFLEVQSRHSWKTPLILKMELEER